eukprot:2762998-Amphidinium_carterae.1
MVCGPSQSAVDWHGLCCILASMSSFIHVLLRRPLPPKPTILVAADSSDRLLLAGEKATSFTGRLPGPLTPERGNRRNLFFPSDHDLRSLQP